MKSTSALLDAVHAGPRPLPGRALRMETPCVLKTVLPRQDKHWAGSLGAARAGVVPRDCAEVSAAELMLVL